VSKFVSAFASALTVVKSAQKKTKQEKPRRNSARQPERLRHD
jgi:hypothetical protein